MTSAIKQSVAFPSTPAEFFPFFKYSVKHSAATGSLPKSDPK